MTSLAFLGPAGLSLILLAASRVPVELRDRIVRWTAWAGVGLGVAVFLSRDSLSAWRGLEFAPGEAAVVGVGIACTWGLVIALDLGASRWWAGALAGVAATGLVGFAAARWAIPGLLFLGCGSAALCVGASRTSRGAWLSLALADGGIAAVLIADVVAREGWRTPTHINVPLLVPLLVACAIRIGLMVRLGPLALIAGPAAAMAPLVLVGGLIPVARWVERPLPLVAACVLLLGVVVAGWSVLRRSFDPSISGVWPVALGAGLLLTSEAATIPAAVAVVLAMTVVVLWPDALERGRLSRGLMLSGLVPTVMFGAVGIAARESFAAATAGGPTTEVASWLVVSGLLPVAFATGVAVGIFAARSEASGGYHPEAVFMTWVALAASVLAGLALGPGEIYASLGGGPAATMFAVALLCGVGAAIRSSRASGEAVSDGPSSRVVLGTGPRLGTWAGALSVAVLVAGAGAIAWVTVRGLQQGFL